MAAKPGSKQHHVNHSSPALNKAKLGDVVAELVAQVNSLTTKYNAAMAKLDTAGATVTGLGTNYVATVGAPATVIQDMESRAS